MWDVDYTNLVKVAGLDMTKPVENVFTGDVGFFKECSNGLIFIPLDKWGIPKSTSYKIVSKLRNEDRVVREIQETFKHYDGDAWCPDALIDSSAYYERGFNFPGFATFVDNCVVSCDCYKGRKKIPCIRVTFKGTKKEMEKKKEFINNVYGDFVLESSSIFEVTQFFTREKWHSVVFIMDEKKLKKFLGQVCA